MQITVTRQGGLAGVTGKPVTVDTGGLPPGEREKLERLVNEADFFSLPPIVEAEIGADLPRCEVTAREGERQHTVLFVGESGEAEPLDRLARAVEEATA